MRLVAYCVENGTLKAEDPLGQEALSALWNASGPVTLSE